ncbi:glycosyltransferase [Flavobacterium ardleyense]|uniref:glycosyltransferase n=1 Tax=Flavobacterium ardleyense TaxID=2038737 RepID=UPI00298CE537|nr:glycosyltransferase [Flavobacterium ardleyense]
MSQKILIIGIVWPEPKSSAAGTRMLQLLQFLKSYDYEITFCSAAMRSDYSLNFYELNIATQQIELNSSSFDDYIKSQNPDIVIFDRFMIEEQYGWRVAENCPDALRILDTEDLHCLRLARQVAYKKGTEFELDSLLLQDVAKREMASILRCDLSLIISEFEMQVLQNVFNISEKLLHYIPIFAEKSTGVIASFEERNNFLFIGNYLHEPNKQAALLLKKEIWPLIRKQLPEAKIQIYGAYATQEILQLNNIKEGFLVKCRAQDANEVMVNSRVLLAPMPFGAGLKGKLLESMQNGTPSITTNIGAEGISNNANWNGFVTDDYNEFANAAVRLYSDKEDWNSAQEKGFKILTNRFDKSLFEDELQNRIVELQKNLKAHRKQNFFGALLQHHTLTSSKYLSKWIEAKNK